jgi:hypothetical protein
MSRQQQKKAAGPEAAESVDCVINRQTGFLTLNQTAKEANS